MSLKWARDCTKVYLYTYQVMCLYLLGTTSFKNTFYYNRTLLAFNVAVSCHNFILVAMFTRARKEQGNEMGLSIYIVSFISNTSREYKYFYQTFKQLYNCLHQ